MNTSVRVNANEVKLEVGKIYIDSIGGRIRTIFDDKDDYYNIVSIRYLYDGMPMKNSASELVRYTKSGVSQSGLVEKDIVAECSIWSKVKKDAIIWVYAISCRPWNKRHFARYENGKIGVYKDGKTSWTTDNDDIFWVSEAYAKLAEKNVSFEDCCNQNEYDFI